MRDGVCEREGGCVREGGRGRLGGGYGVGRWRRGGGCDRRRVVVGRTGRGDSRKAGGGGSGVAAWEGGRGGGRGMVRGEKCVWGGRL